MGTIELTTKRLILRRYNETDALPLFLHFGRNAKMYEFSGWNPYATEEMAAEITRMLEERHRRRQMERAER